MELSDMVDLHMGIFIWSLSVGLAVMNRESPTDAIYGFVVYPNAQTGITNKL
jgi:hypothetical protein